jgi:hypothetical protein
MPSTGEMKFSPSLSSLPSLELPTMTVHTSEHDIVEAGEGKLGLLMLA